MSNRQSIEKRMADRALARLGHDVWHKGIKYTGHLSSYEIEDETGYRKAISVGLKHDDLTFFVQGDNLLIDNQNYVIRHIPKYTHQEILVNIELTRA